MADGCRRGVVGQPSDREMINGVLAAGGPTPGLSEQARSLGRPGLVANGNNAVELYERMLAEGGPTPGLLDQVRSLGRPGLIANSNNSVPPAAGAAGPSMPPAAAAAGPVGPPAAAAAGPVVPPAAAGPVAQSRLKTD